MFDVILPQLGESVSEGTITKWLVKEGDVIKGVVVKCPCGQVIELECVY